MRGCVASNPRNDSRLFSKPLLTAYNTPNSRTSALAVLGHALPGPVSGSGCCFSLRVSAGETRQAHTPPSPCLSLRRKEGTLQKENDIDTPRARPRPSTHVLNHTPIPNIPQPTGGSHGEPIPWRALPTRRGRDTKHVARRDVHRGRWAPQPRQRAWACHICPTTTLGLALSILC